MAPVARHRKPADPIIDFYKSVHFPILTKQKPHRNLQPDAPLVFMISGGLGFLHDSLVVRLTVIADAIFHDAVGCGELVFSRH